ALTALGPPPQLDSATWVGKAIVDMATSAIHVDDTTIDMASEGRLSIKAMAIAGVTREGDAITGFSTTLDGMIVGIDDIDDASEQATLKALGYQAVDLSFALGSHYDTTARSLVIDPLRVSFKDAGTLSANLSLSNVPQTSALGGLTPSA